MVNSLTRQAFALRARFPDATGRLTPGRFVWTGRLQPTPVSRVYTIRIVLSNGRFPCVEVIEPTLETRPGESLPHVFDDGSLCLHLENEWTSAMLMADTTVPWTSEWLINYEIWKATGVWYGGGPWPPPRTPGSRTGRSDPAQSPVPPFGRDLSKDGDRP